jgi:hypothetical protein
VVSAKITVFQDVTMCILADVYRRFSTYQKDMILSLLITSIALCKLLCFFILIKIGISGNLFARCRVLRKQSICLRICLYCRPRFFLAFTTEA